MRSDIIGVNDIEFQRIPFKMKELSANLWTLFGWKQSLKIKSFRENKFIDISTHSLHNISIVLSLHGIYFVWGKGLETSCLTVLKNSTFSLLRMVLSDIYKIYFGENKNGLKESNLKSYDEIFAEELEITINNIRIQSDSDFIPMNNKYSNSFYEISWVGKVMAKSLKLKLFLDISVLSKIMIIYIKVKNFILESIVPLMEHFSKNLIFSKI